LGHQLWININGDDSQPPIQVAGLATNFASNVIVVANANISKYVSFSYTFDGTNVWSAYDPTGDLYGDPPYDLFSAAHAMVVDKFDNVLITGQNAYDYPVQQYGTYKIDPSGSCVWTNLYPAAPTGVSVGTAIAVDQFNNVYVTGYSPGSNGTNNIVTIKYAPSGNQLWVQSYNGLNAGNAAGTAIAVDKNGNVYVTGYETLPGGGTGIVTIKYIPISIQRQTNGTVVIETQGSPGAMFDIEASTNLVDWLDLGSAPADTNGLIQFLDTNAPNFPSRFYYTTPQ
ncbi:MAG TPA: SBBP repeat-containing protein, partial [Candidatus Cybelea sp.]|nr:SBBP repeat-containing protein [Candidatus Cybelea sp.]